MGGRGLNWSLSIGGAIFGCCCCFMLTVNGFCLVQRFLRCMRYIARITTISKMATGTAMMRANGGSPELAGACLFACGPETAKNNIG